MSDNLTALGSVADIRQGRYLAKTDMAGARSAQTPVPVHGANGIIGWTTKPMYESGVPLVTCRGSNSGMILWAEGPLWVSNNAMAIVPHNGQRKFAYYSLLHRPPYSTVSGSAQPQITRTALSPFECFWPDDSDQQGIADTLTALDEKIKLNRRMNETLEEMAQAIFRDWFVDFGPVRRAQAGAADPVAIMGGLTPDPARAAQLAALFPAAFGNDGLPVGWDFAPLIDLLVLQRGFDLPKTTRTDGDFPVIAASGPSGTHNEFKVKGPGVCTGRSGVLGGVYYVDGDFWPLNTSLWVKDYPGCTALYAFHLLRGIDLAGFNAGSAVPTLNRNHIHGLPTVKPPMAVIEAFDGIVSSFYAKMASGRAENETLAETRDYLLPRLMSGAVRVAPQAEAA